MTRKIIRVGTSPNDGTGDSLRETANKINYNFAELYNAFGIDGCGANVDINLKPPCGNDLILETCGTGQVIIGPPTQPVITVPPPETPGPVIISPPPTKEVIIGKPDCGSVISVPDCTTEKPIVIGPPIIDPEVVPTKPTLIIPTIPTEPIVVDPGPDGEVKIGHTDPTPTDPTAPHPPQITVPANPNQPITIDPGSGGGGGGGGGGVDIGNPDDPTIHIPPDDSQDKAQIGSPTKPVDVFTGQGPWEIVYTNAQGKLDSSEWLRVCADDKDSEGKAIHLHISEYETSNNLAQYSHKIKQNSIYFVDPNMSEELAEAYPTKRVASIRYRDEGSFGKGITITPNPNWNDSAFSSTSQGFGVWRWIDNGIQNAKTTLNADCAGPSRHGVYIGRGAIDFFQDLEGGENPNTDGLAYICMPGIGTADGSMHVGQIFANPYRNEDPDGSPTGARSSFPYWGLGWTTSTQLIENQGSFGGDLEKNDRKPNHESIIWDVRNRVSINGAELTKSFNVKSDLRLEPQSGTVSSPTVGTDYQSGIYFADGSYQYTAWAGLGAGKSLNIVGTANEVEVTGPVNNVYTIGLPDNVVITGNLTVNGTTTTINSTTLTVDDKNIELGSVTTPTDDTANGGGITLKGATDKTINWDKTKDRWVFNKGVDVVDAVVNNLTANKFVKTDANKKLVSSDITWADIGSPDCGTAINIGHSCNDGDGLKIPAGNDTTNPLQLGNGSNPTKLGGGGDGGGTGITLPKNGSGDPIKLGSPIQFPDGTTQSTAAKTYSHSAETATGGAFIRLKGTATGTTDTTDDVKLANGTNVTITRTDADTITIAANNTTYSHSAETTSGGAMIRLTDSAGTNDDIKLIAGTNVTITRNDADTITFASTDTNTIYSQSAETTTGGAFLRLTGSDSTNDDIKLAAGSNMTITRTDANTVTFEAGDTFFNKGTGSGDLVFNRADGTVQMITLTGNVTSVTLVGVGVAKSFTIIFKQDATGGRTVTTAPEFKFASGYKTFSSAANAIDMLNIFSDGTTFYCTLTTGYA